MVIPEEREGKLPEDPSLARDLTPANQTVSSRKGGLQMVTSIKPRQVTIFYQNDNLM